MRPTRAGKGDACGAPAARRPDALPTEAPNPRSHDLDLLSTHELVALVFREDRAAQRACAAVAASVARFADVCAERMARGGRVFYVGAGTSGRLGVLDAAELGPTFSLGPGRVVALLAGGPGAVWEASEGAEDDAEAGARELVGLGLSATDAVLGVSASGRTAYVLGALAAARRAGAATAALVCNPPPAELVADVVLLLDTGPEVLAGSTRMKAGTATKMTLNALSLAVMVRLGKVHGNRMVDLRGGSRKLAARARGLVEELAGVDPGTAGRLLARAGGDVRVAVLTGALPLTPCEAALLLAASGGSLRAALARGRRAGGAT